MRRARRLLSLRVRITVCASLVVVIALAGAGALLLRAAERSVRSQIDSTLRANADFITRAVASGEVLPREQGPSDIYVQFVMSDGRVLGASSSAAGLPALALPLPSRTVDRGTRITTTSSSVLGPLRVLAVRSHGAPGVTLVVARSAAPLSSLRDTLVHLIVAMVLAGSLLLGVLVWLVVGRALRPVEIMRRTTQELSEHALDRRLATTGRGDELDRLAATLNDLLDRLEAALARERRFAADASHELRTPLAALRAIIETEAGGDDSRERSRADELERLSQLESLVDELLVLARADTPGRVERLVDVDELVMGTACQLRVPAGISVDTSSVSAGQVIGRDEELCRVVENLANNAVRHARSRVCFSLSQRDGIVELAVSDDGSGVPIADRLRVFERFATLDDARTSGGTGFGLGLAIAATIVSTHHGTIVVDDGPEGGARFVVRLPASTARDSVLNRT